MVVELDPALFALHRPLLAQANHVEPLQHPDGSGAALVVRRDDSQRALIIEERLTVDGIRDDDSLQ
jgi:hypothetical protein